MRPPLGWAARLRPRLWLVPKNVWAGCPNQHRNRPHQGVIMPKKVLFIVSNAHAIGPHNRRTGNFLPEVAHPYAEFDRAGYQIHFASLTGDTPFLDALNLADDPESNCQMLWMTACSGVFGLLHPIDKPYSGNHLR